MRKLSSVVLLAAALFLSAPAAAQNAAAPPAGSAQAVAQRALTALATRNADAFTRESHPQELAMFRARMLPGIQQAMNTAQKDQVLTVFAPARTFAEIEKLPADRLFTRYLQGAMNQMSATKLQITNTVLGQVAEGDSLAHVVYRQRIVAGTNPPASNVALLSLRRSPGGWKVIIEAGMMGTPGAQPPAR